MRLKGNNPAGPSKRGRLSGGLAPMSPRPAHLDQLEATREKLKALSAKQAGRQQLRVIEGAKIGRPHLTPR